MKLRDQRNGGWFWAQNELFDVFQPLIGVHGVSVYMAMCRLLGDPKSNGRLSLRDIAEQSGVSKSQVQRTRAELVALGMIAEKASGSNTPSTFDLLDLRAAAQPGPEELKRRLTLSQTRDAASDATQKSVPGMKAGTVESVPPRDTFDAKTQHLRGSPQNESVPPRDTLSVSGTEVSQDEGHFAPVFNSLNKDLRERENTRASATGNLFAAAEPDEKVLDLIALAGMIVVAHPRARMLGWTELDVQASDRDAVVEAARAEARLVACTPEDAAVRMLGMVQRIAREVPREKWRFVSPIEKFFRRREYRAKPRDLYSGDDPSQATRQPRPDAAVGMNAPPPARTSDGREAALTYWRSVRDRPIYEREAPRWVKAQLAAEPSATQPAA